MSYSSEKQTQGNIKLRMIARVKKDTDCVIIILALGALLCNLILPLKPCVNNTICITLGVIGFIYVLRVICLWSQKPRLDWFLIHGHFLRKVVCIVLLMPFLLTAISQIFISSPKELAYEQGLYECNDKELPCSIKREQESPNMFWSTYYHFVDPGNQHMTTTKSGRAFAAIVSILGILLLNGLLVSSLIGWFDNRKERWLNGKVKYPGFLRRNQHYVIIGGNDMVASIVCQLFDHCEQTSVGNDSAIAKSSSSENDGQSEEKSTSLIQNLINWLKGIFTSKPYILIQTSRDVESFRRELFSELPADRQWRVIIYYGNRTSADDIEDLILESAKEVYILGEDTRTDDIESYHDTMNMECLNLMLEYYKEKTQQGERIAQLLEEIAVKSTEIEAAKDDQQTKSNLENEKRAIENELRKNQLSCRVMFEYQTTFSVFQFYDLDRNTSCYINFKPFNYYEMWAQKVLVCKEIDEKKLDDLYMNGGYLPLEGRSGITKGDDDYVHLFIVGISRMGMAMGIEAAHLAHYPNYTEEKKIRTKITFIDRNADEEKDFFMGRFKELFALSHWRYGTLDKNSDIKWQQIHTPDGWDYLGGDFLDIEWEFINGGIGQTSIQDYILSCATPSARVTIAICLPESNRSHAAALYLHKKIYESDSVQQILVYNRYGNSIIKALNSKNRMYPYLNKIKSFGSPKECLSLAFLIQSEKRGDVIGSRYEEIRQEKIIKMLEEAGQTEGKGGYNGKSSTAKSWSNVYNSITTWTKLRSISYKGGNLTTDQTELLSDVEHNRWNIEQLLMNFRPLTRSEQDDVIKRNKDKEDLKSEMAHLNICSNKRLKDFSKVDAAARAYDEGLTELLPDIYKDIQ